MIESEVALAQAIGEVESPTWAVTSQYLAVHRVAREPDGRPRVARIDEESEAGVSNVYFELCDLCGDKADYHLVVAVRPGDCATPGIGGVWIEPLTRVKLSVWSETISPDELTAKIGVTPTSSWVKGAPRDRGRSRRVHSHNGWQLDALPGVPATMDEKLECLRKEIGNSVTEIASLGSSCETMLSIGLDDWAGQFTGVYLDAENSRWIASMGASIDISIYSWGPQMEEEDS